MRAGGVFASRTYCLWSIDTRLREWRSPDRRGGVEIPPPPRCRGPRRQKCEFQTRRARPHAAVHDVERTGACSCRISWPEDGGRGRRAHFAHLVGLDAMKSPDDTNIFSYPIAARLHVRVFSGQRGPSSSAGSARVRFARARGRAGRPGRPGCPSGVRRATGAGHASLG